MSNRLGHQDIQELLGAYALDAVEGDEADAIELHLRDCPRCRAEVESHRETASWLAHGGASAPEGVWDKIAESMEEAPPRLDMARILPFEAGRSDRPRRRPPVTWLLTAAAAVLIVVLGTVAVRQEGRLNRFEKTRGLDAALAAAVSDPDARQVRLQSPTGAVGTVRAVLLPDGTGYLVAAALPAARGDRTYQLWGIVGDRAVSLGVLGRDPKVVPFHAGAGVTTLAVTEEVAGGVVVSQNQPVVAGGIPLEA
jgi:anti-sigma factor RsiW